MPDADVLTELQAQATARCQNLELPENAKALLRELRTLLIKGHNAKKIFTPPQDVNRVVQLLPPPEKIRKQLEHYQLEKAASCIIVGNEKNQERDPTLPHIKRNDGAWFDFAITVREGVNGLELLAYDFEIRLPAALGAPFLRFDLNLPGHANEVRELRCHLHPGFDDVLVPAPLMTPTELLTVFIEHLRPTREIPRTPTTFEVDWFRRTFVEARLRVQKTTAQS